MELSQFDVHQLLSANRALIADVWQLFVSVHLALFAVAMFSPTRKDSHAHLLWLTPFYIGFLYLNFRAQSDNYLYAQSLLEYLDHQTQASVPQAAIITADSQRVWVLQYLAAIYVGTGLFSSLVILWFARRTNRRQGGGQASG